MRVFAIGLFTALILFVAAGSVLAEGEEGAQTPYPLTTGGGLVGIGAGLGAGLVVVGAGIGISRIAAASVESIARQPEASGDIRGSMIITAALIEGVALFAAVICLLIQLNITKMM